jgi:hypothetical protein
VVSKKFKKVTTLYNGPLYRILVATAAVCNHQLLVTYFIIFDDIPTASEARVAKRHKNELTTNKRNLSLTYA